MKKSSFVGQLSLGVEGMDSVRHAAIGKGAVVGVQFQVLGSIMIGS